MNVKSIAIATLVAGTLDIGSAIAMTAARGKSVAAMLSFVASGPFGDGVAQLGAAGAIAGLAVHFGIMTAMVTIFAATVDRLPALRRRPLGVGAAYGLLLYLVMYWIVIPLRWPETLNHIRLGAIANALTIHVLLVGIPIAWIVARPVGSRERTLSNAPLG